jgi:hypothetical protein
VAALVIVAAVYLLIGCCLVIALLAPYLFNQKNAPPFWFVLAVMFGWLLFVLWAWLTDGIAKRKQV